MSRWYKLDANGEAIPAADEGDWSRNWGGNDSRRVALDDITDRVSVSTVFLGLDHAFDGGPPLIWETMVFAKDHPAIDQVPYRCSTRAEAVEQHAEVLAETRTHIASCPGGCEWRDDE